MLAVLELMPADDWITDEDLTAAVVEHGIPVTLKDGHIVGLRSLRRAGMAVCTSERHWKRTPTGVRATTLQQRPQTRQETRP